MPPSPRESAIEIGQKCLQAPPVVVLGSGASVPFGLPSMQSLARHLQGSSPATADGQQSPEMWTQFLSVLSNGTDLESALQKCDLTDQLTDHIVNQTWTAVAAADFNVFEQMISNRKIFSLSRLYRHLFDSTHRTATVVTTNYDRLAEYAADCAGYSHNTGFTNGYLRRSSLEINTPIANRKAMNLGRRVDVWKVHGCLDWFHSPTSATFAVMSARSIPPTSRPAIITPGTTKYEQSHQEPFRSIITRADFALRQASGYLCIGFGFNDKHIQPILLERWHSGDAILVILTKKLSASAKKMLHDSGGYEFLAMEQSGADTLVRCHKWSDAMRLANQDLWKLGPFLNEII